MSWIAEAWAKGKDGDAAVKLTVRSEEEPGPNELAALRAEAVGFFRRQFGDWTAGPQSSKREV